MYFGRYHTFIFSGSTNPSTLKSFGSFLINPKITKTDSLLGADFCSYFGSFYVVGPKVRGYVVEKKNKPSFHFLVQ